LTESSAGSARHAQLRQSDQHIKPNNNNTYPELEIT